MGIKNKKILFAISGLFIFGFFLADVSSKEKEKSSYLESVQKHKEESVENETIKKAVPVNDFKNSENNNPVKTSSLNVEKEQEEMSIFSKNELLIDSVDYKDKIQIDGNVPGDLIELLNNELNKVPGPILDKYFSIGGKIILTSYDIATTYYNDHVIGSLMELYDDRQKVLYVSARSNAIKKGAIHGIGHAFDSMTGWKSYTTNQFIDIFNEEKDTIKTTDGGNYHKTSVKEYFAEAFYSLLVNPSTTEKTAPKTANFLRMLICEI